MGGARDPRTYLELVDWRRRVGDMYRAEGQDALQRFRAAKDELFATHPQSPIPAGDRAAFGGLRYFAPDPSLKIAARLLPHDDESELVIATGGDDGDIRYRRAGLLTFTLQDVACRLSVFAMTTYGGGLFLPFRDLTAGKQTYGAGRYLFDTVKNTDGLCLEFDPAADEVTIDFNYAYNPSCAYDDRWACPLAPRENWLPLAVNAGELSYHGVDGAGPGVGADATGAPLQERPEVEPGQ